MPAHKATNPQDGGGGRRDGRGRRRREGSRRAAPHAHPTTRRQVSSRAASGISPAQNCFAGELFLGNAHDNEFHRSRSIFIARAKLLEASECYSGPHNEPRMIVIASISNDFSASLELFSAQFLCDTSDLFTSLGGILSKKTRRSAPQMFAQVALHFLSLNGGW